MVQPLIPDARVLDLFAGSGALGLEALSRGAAFCDFVDLSAESVRLIRANASTLDASARLEVHKGDAMRFAERLPPRAYDLAFADPPYQQGLAARLAELWLAVPFAHVLGVEHNVHEPMPDGGETRRYGQSAITLFGRR